MKTRLIILVAILIITGALIYQAFKHRRFNVELPPRTGTATNLAWDYVPNVAVNGVLSRTDARLYEIQQEIDRLAGEVAALRHDQIRPRRGPRK
jgi:hypothetical protein